MPASYKDVISPELAAKYTYTEDGKYSKELNIPTYEWMPKDSKPRAIILGIHGLTLHGRRFRVLARSLAVNGIGFIALDMRGFGASHFEPNGTLRPKEDERTKVDNEKSYEEIVQLTELIKKDYPDIKLIALGESLGCTFCLKLAADHPDLVSGVILSAPAVRVNKSMYAGKGQIREGIKAALSVHHEIDLESFFAELCSNREPVKREMLDDPFVLKKLSIRSLLATDIFVDKTSKFAKPASEDLQVLILQGGRDGCVSPTHVTDLMKALSSDHQTLAWHGNFGHLQLETIFMRAETLDALSGWMMLHNNDNRQKMKQLQESIASLGGDVVE
ncbi:MAG: lysophospholipase [Candidatus Obscuribacterales bacterium]|nr:lysophospholipase [Candidatus Obscuribacterales bacterium]